MNHSELVEKLKLVGKPKREIETLLGMPKNSLSGMMNDEKRMPRKWFEALESFVICTDISTGKADSLGQPIEKTWIEGQEELAVKKLNERMSVLIEEIPGLKPASEIAPLIFHGPKLSQQIKDEPLQWKESGDSENELLGKSVMTVAKKLKQDPYELIAWVLENFGKKPEPKLKDKAAEKQTAHAGETYFQKRQREKNGIKND